jgi:hypothetical protein
MNGNRFPNRNRPPETISTTPFLQGKFKYFFQSNEHLEWFFSREFRRSADSMDAVCSFSQRLEHGEDVSIDERIIARLRMLVELSEGKHMEEVVQLFEQIGTN